MIDGECRQVIRYGRVSAEWRIKWAVKYGQQVIYM